MAAKPSPSQSVQVETFFKSGPAAKTPPRRRKGLSRSARPPQADRDVYYLQQKHVVFDRSGGRCEAQVAGVCTGTANDAHHIQRSTDDGTDNAANLMAICRPCHGWIHADIIRAHEHGLLFLPDYSKKKERRDARTC